MAVLDPVFSIGPQVMAKWQAYIGLTLLGKGARRRRGVRLMGQEGCGCVRFHAGQGGMRDATP
jgi:hypothetical protein